MKILLKSKQFLLLCLLLAGAGYVSAQDYRAIVKGVVTDEMGEGVIGANMLNKDWGSGHNLSVQRIYSIKGFDQDAKQYTYNVNANTGVSSLNGTPFQVQIGLRYGF